MDDHFKAVGEDEGPTCCRPVTTDPTPSKTLPMFPIAGPNSNNDGPASSPGQPAACAISPIETLSCGPGLDDAPCCGPRPASPSSDLERPGYRLWPFVEDFIDTPAGPTPRVKTTLDRPDLIGSIAARLGGVRDNYKIAPGLYAVGRPGPESIVLVTANYKLTFDHVRKSLSSVDAWILVLDTRGINVWCAAGKKLFSTEELVKRVKLTKLEQVVKHRELILPQLAATGVSGHQVKKGCGFKVIWGPIKAREIKRFIEAGKQADKTMRLVTFTTLERLVLVPIEISILLKPALWVLLAIFLISGLGPGIFTPSAAWTRGLMAGTALIAGILAGAVAAPILLPWLPVRTFALKGALTGVIAGALAVWGWWPYVDWLGCLAMILLSVAFSSYLAMNFTGSTPFTSPSGVEKEMRKAIPFQAAALVVSVIAWIGAAF